VTIKKIALFSAVASIFFSIANANSLYDTYRGQYLSVNAGASYANNVFSNGKSSSGFLGFGGDLFLGDQVSPYFSPEVVLDYFDLSPMGGGAIVFGLDGRFTVPVSEHIALFARLGPAVGYIRTCVSGLCRTSNGLVPALGLGAGYALTQQWTLSLEFNGAYFPKSTANGNGLIGAATIGATRFFYQ